MVVVVVVVVGEGKRGREREKRETARASLPDQAKVDHLALHPASPPPRSLPAACLFVCLFVRSRYIAAVYYLLLLVFIIYFQVVMVIGT